MRKVNRVKNRAKFPNLFLAVIIVLVSLIGVSLSPALPPLAMLSAADVASATDAGSGNTLIADSGNNGVIEINNTGTIVWSYSTGLAFPRDVERLSNGNTLISDTHNDRVIEVDTDGTIVWEYTSEYHTAAKVARLPNGNTLIADGHPGNRVIEVDPDGTIVWQVDDTTTELHYPSDAERLSNGNTLIADTDNARVIEVDTDGTIVWSYSTGLSHPHDVDRLPNGNTLISSAGNDRVIEVDTAGDIVWEYTKVHPEEADRLPNGNTLISTGLENRVIEVDPDGDIVWEYATGLNDVNDAERFEAAAPTPTPTPTPTPEGGACFIATAAYGTPMAEEIGVLREFRDEYLLTNPVGQAFVEFYYEISPPMAEFIDEHPALKPIVRVGLLPAVAMSTVAVNTTLAEKIAVVSLLALIATALAVWARKRRKGSPYSSG